MWLETFALLLFMLALRRNRQQYDEYRAPIQYMNALCRTAEIACTISEFRALPPKLAVKWCTPFYAQL